MPRAVTCMNCGFLIETGPPAEPLHARPCPRCGSRRRRVTGSASAALTFTATARGEALDAKVVELGTAQETEEALPITVHKTQPKTTDIGMAAHSCEFRMMPPSDDLSFYYVEVVRREEVVASGMGDNLVDALVGVIEFMLPPNHEDYPPD